jgi:hypothetical protein
MHRDADQVPASPAHGSALSMVLVWIALGLLGWIVLAAVAFVVYLAVTRLI